jgi:hypothetical protein
VTRWKHPQPFKLRLLLGNRLDTLLGRLLRFVDIGSTQHDLVVLIFVKQGLLIVEGVGSDFHLDRMLLCILFDLFEMLVVAVLGEPSDDILIGPVNLEGVSVFVVDVILYTRSGQPCLR